MLTPLDLLRRRQALAWVLTLTENTRFAPRSYEQHLLERYAGGELELEHIPGLLAARVHQLLYHSRATRAFTEVELTDLVAHSRPYNTYHDITGVLCYCDGHFVQLLEGPEKSVLELYALIRRDSRHEQVETLRDAAGPTRWFADWRMALTMPPPPPFHGLLTHLEARVPTLEPPPLSVTDPHLLTLWRALTDLSLPT